MIDEALKSNSSDGIHKTENDFKSVLNDSCKIIRKYRSKCLAWVDKYSQDIYNVIVGGFNLNETCSTLNICPKNEWIKDKGPNSVSKSPYECFECQHLIKGIESKVGNDRSKEHIEIVLQQSCSSISNADLKKKCFDFVDGHKDYIVTSLMNQMPPKQMCHGLGFCAAHSNKIDVLKSETMNKMMKKNLSHHSKSGASQCLVCKLIAENLDQLLKENSTINQIDYAVHKVCALVPKNLFTNCEDTIENYAEIIISYLLSASPKQLCTDLKFCSSAFGKQFSQRDNNSETPEQINQRISTKHN